MTENISVLTHSSIKISFEDKNIYFDPFHLKGEPHDADYIFITHEHYDHFSPEDIKKAVSENTVLIIPASMEDKVGESASLFKNIFTVNPSMSQKIDGINIETIPAYNILKPFHPKSAKWVGYIVVLGGKRIYIAGDTDATKEAKAVKCDIALVPVGGIYTMNVNKAAELVNIIQPEAAIPTHYGSIVGKPEYGAAFADKVIPEVKVELKIKF